MKLSKVEPACSLKLVQLPEGYALLAATFCKTSEQLESLYKANEDAVAVRKVCNSRTRRIVNDIVPGVAALKS